MITKNWTTLVDKYFIQNKRKIEMHADMDIPKLTDIN